jgi:hypothetical protein
MLPWRVHQARDGHPCHSSGDPALEGKQRLDCNISDSEAECMQSGTLITGVPVLPCTSNRETAGLSRTVFGAVP